MDENLGGDVTRESEQDQAGSVDERGPEAGTAGDDATNGTDESNRDGDSGSRGTGSERTRSGWGSFTDIQEAVTDLVDSAIRNVSSGGGRHPRYDLVDLGERGYVLSFDLPGLEKTDVEVSATEGEITISGTRPRPTLPEGGEVIRSERSYGRFQRALRVPADVDVGRISARMTSGVLEISLPRKEDRESRHVVVE